MSDAYHASPPNHTAAHMLLALGMGATVGFGCIADDWISAGFVFLVVLTAYVGYWSGMLKIASSILGLLAAIRFAPTFSPHVDAYTQGLSLIPELFRTPICLLVAGILVAIVVVLIVRVAAYYLFQWKPHWKGVDRWAGAALGTVQGVVISAMLLFAMVVLEPILEQHAARRSSAKSTGTVDQWSGHIYSFTDQARVSSIGPIMDTLDPMRDHLQQRVDEVTETIVSQTESDDGSQQNLSQLIRKFQEDAEAQRVLSERSGLDLETIRSVLDSPEIDRAIKDPRIQRIIQRQ